MRALILTMGLFLFPAAAFADDLGECMKTCDEIIRVCTESCGKKAKGGPAACKPQCTTVGDSCKKDCKNQGGGAEPAKTPAPEKAP